MDAAAGHSLALRLVDTGDAAYVHGLRTDARYNRHLSEVKGTVESQRRWIESYKQRESRKEELYYLVQRLDDGRPCGLVRLYDIRDSELTWGSWILDENKPRKAALECVLLSFGVAFEVLEVSRIVLDVRRGNRRAIAFYRRFGMRETHHDDIDLYFDYSRQQYQAAWPLLLNSLETESTI